jgi:hypothetical protein
VGALGEVAELRWRQHSEGALPRWQLAGELAFSR